MGAFSVPSLDTSCVMKRKPQFFCWENYVELDQEKNPLFSSSYLACAILHVCPDELTVVLVC